MVLGLGKTEVKPWLLPWLVREEIGQQRLLVQGAEH